jgi:hypothetical protein
MLPLKPIVSLRDTAPVIGVASAWAGAASAASAAEITMSLRVERLLEAVDLGSCASATTPDHIPPRCHRLVAARPRLTRFASPLPPKEREGRSALPLLLGGSGQSLSPALADIIGARRVRTAVMTSSGSIPCR